jgi:thiamine biosynthesis lipoprotein
MGSLATITLYAETARQAEAAFRRAFDRIAELDGVLSDYRIESELSRACESAAPLSGDLFTVVAHGQALAEKTGGAFDLTAGAITRVWRTARREGRLPRQRDLEEARRRSGYGLLRLRPEERTIECLVPGMHLDAGGIAKGYAADEALAEIRRAGVRSALIAMSGDIVTGDPPPGRQGWRVQAMGEVLTLANTAISTSGDEFQRLQVGKDRYSHVVDPRTGRALRNAPTVSVVARTGIEADSLATAISVGGPEMAKMFESECGVRVLMR